MAKEFKLPDLGEGIASGDIVNVLVAEGDTLKKDQTVVEIETDKAVLEVPSSVAGKVTRVHVGQGDKVNVGDVLVTVDEAGGAAAAGGAAQEPAPAKAEQADRKEASPAASKEAKAPSRKPPAAAKKSSAPRREAEKPKPEQKEAPARKPAAAEMAQGGFEAAPPARPAPAGDDELIAAGPATRRLARELGVDLRDLAAAHPDERLTEEHVKAFVRERLHAGPAEGGSSPGPMTSMAAPALPDFSQWGAIEREPLSSLRRKAAEQLHTGWSLAPHVTQFDEADVSAIESMRKRYKERKGDDGVKLTVTAFVLKAAAAALREFPWFNASLDHQRGELILKHYYHLGVAVDTEAGLIVPVIRDVDTKSVIDLAVEMEELAEKTRERKVGLDQLRGGTFTITNLGGIGGTGFTPIINYPEVAILGIARTRDVPAVRDGQLITRKMMPLCLSYDHRVVNGADGARFTRRLVELLESPDLLLLEG